jgi:hypothetical protein
VTGGVLTHEDAPRPLRRGGSCSDRARAELGGTGPGELATVTRLDNCAGAYRFGRT